MEIDKIVQHVAKAYNLSPDMLTMANTRLKYVLWPRQTLIYIAKTYFNMRNRDIIRNIATNHSKIARSIEAVEKRMRRPDVKKAIKALVCAIKEEKPLNCNPDLDYLKKMCTQIGDCWVLSTTTPLSCTSLGKKYQVVRGNQLYYLLVNGHYPASKEQCTRMTRTCTTVGCIVHWKGVQGSDGLLITEDEEIDIFSPDEKLLHAIIKSAVDEKDIEYFQSNEFKKHLSYLDIEKKEAIFDKIASVIYS